MPSTSPAQGKLMNIAAHTPGGYGGVPQSVGQDFHQADKLQGGKHPIWMSLLNRKTTQPAS